MHVFKRSPFVKIVIVFIVGILLQKHLDFTWNTLVVMFCINIAFISTYKFLPLRFQFIYEKYLNIGYILIIILIGSTIFKYRTQNIPGFPEDDKMYYGIIQDIPEEKENTTKQTMLVKAYKDSNKWIQNNAQILTYIQKDSTSHTLKPGDNILFRESITNIKNYGNPNEFDFKKYLATHSIHYQTYIPENHWTKLDHTHNYTIRSISNSYRQQLINAIENKTEKPGQLAVASALILGYKDYLTPELTDKFSSSGATHILAVSGLHVGIIFLLFHYLLIFMEKRQWSKILKTGLIVAILTVYAFLTGLSPSVSRATLMFSLIAITRITGRDSSIYNTLALSAFVLLFVNPLLLYALSFQLSYLAVLSIVFFQPKIYSWVNLSAIPDKFWQWLTVAIAAQFGTAPLVIHYFHQFPTYFWLTNFIAIPAATVIIITGFMFFLITPISENIADIFAWLLQNTIEILNQLIEAISNLPFSVLSDIYLNSAQVVICYSVILSAGLFILLRSGKQVLMILCSILLFLSIKTGEKYWTTNDKELIIYNIPEHSVYNYISLSHNLVLTDSTFALNKDKGVNELHFFIKNFWIHRNAKKPEIHIINNDTLKKPNTNEYLILNDFMNFRGTKVYRPTANNLETKIPKQKIEIDYLILSNENKIPVIALFKIFEIKHVILDSSLPYYQKQQLKQTLTKKEVAFHDVSEEGAYCIELV